MKRAVLMITAIAAMTTACNQVRVKTSWGFMGPNVYEATDGNVSVKYYNGQCCCIAKEVLQSLADKANRGNFEWSTMRNNQTEILNAECEALGGRPRR